MLSTEFRDYRDGLKAMARELETNRTILDELSEYYLMFLFTGGDVPRTPWSLVELTSCREWPLAGGGILPEEVQRYLHLERAIAELGEKVATARPRSLRCRREIFDRFKAASSEIRTLGRSLESVMTNLLEENTTLQPAPTSVAIPARRRPIFRAFSTRLDGDRSAAPAALQGIEDWETDGGTCR